jgi:hypothetical protein
MARSLYRKAIRASAWMALGAGLWLGSFFVPGLCEISRFMLFVSVYAAIPVTAPGDDVGTTTTYVLAAVACSAVWAVTAWATYRLVRRYVTARP